MTIHFYLDNEEETEITAMYDMVSNPFKVGDVIHLNVEEVYPVDYKEYKEEYRKKLIQSNKELENKFRRKTIKICRAYNSMEFKIINKTKLTIDYYCEFVEG